MHKGVQKTKRYWRFQDETPTITFNLTNCQLTCLGVSPFLTEPLKKCVFPLIIDTLKSFRYIC